MTPRYCPACRTHTDAPHWCAGLEELRQRCPELADCEHPNATPIPGREAWHCPTCDFVGPRPKGSGPLG